MMTEKTKWFPGSVKPARIGWYERKYKALDLRIEPDYFDGEIWFLGLSGVKNNRPASTQDRPCRGLAEPTTALDKGV
jgi:hypothetical protein